MIELDVGWIEVSRVRSRSDAEQQLLVLEAMGIEGRVVMQHGYRWALAVPAHDAMRARHELMAFARENRRPPRLIAPPRRLMDGVDGALAFAACLLFFHGAARREVFLIDWLDAGVARAGEITDGAWWQTVTALCLHADLGHLGGNLLFGVLFSLLLSQLLGTGLAWLAIVFCGALGNGINALLQPPAHAAIGASSVVFAALGMLAALGWWQRLPLPQPGLRRWLPLAAGTMILAYIGFGGERTDIGGHVAGFFCGVAVGVLLCLVEHRLPLGWRAQAAYGASVAGLLVLAWLMALSSL